MLHSQSIAGQLTRILESSEFSTSQRLSKFLRYVVEQTVAGNAENLKAYTIAVEAFGKEKNFDPQDPYIRNIAREVRRALEKYYLSQGVDDPVRIEIPSGSYVPAFELTTDSAPTQPAQLSHTQCACSADASIRSVDIDIENVLMPDLRPLVAVIPFAFQGNDHAHKVLGEVVADEVILGLSRSAELQVISRLSTTVFRERQVSLDDIRSQLNADYVFSGSYRVLAGRCMLIVELAEARSGHIIWADALRGDINAIINGEDELLSRLVFEVSRAVMGRELQRALTQALPTLESHTLLMGAIRLMHRESTRDFERARQMLEILTQRLGQLAIPHAWFAKWHVLRFYRQQGWSIDQRSEAQQALDCTSRALDADSECALALTIDGLIHTSLLQQLDVGQERYEHALQINPNESLAWLLKGTLHAFRGEGELAVDGTERALRLSPLDPFKYYYDSLAATAALSAGRYQRAIELAERSLTLNRNHTSTLRALAIAQSQLGDLEKARQTVTVLMRLDPTLTASSYLERSPSSAYETGKIWSDALRRAGVPE